MLATRSKAWPSRPASEPRIPRGFPRPPLAHNVLTTSRREGRRPMNSSTHQRGRPSSPSVGKGGAGLRLRAAAAGMRHGPRRPDPGGDQARRQDRSSGRPSAWSSPTAGSGGSSRTMDRTLDEASRERLMVANGRSCFAAYAGPPKQKPAPDALEKFTAWIADKGKDRGYSIEGRVISFEFVGSAETGQASPEGDLPLPDGRGPKGGPALPHLLSLLRRLRQGDARADARPSRSRSSSSTRSCGAASAVDSA
ncbi:MAG: hypothetical protein MZU79_07520 [Anaerotruncus sp.]|nr:hypothetical protein [Anaerotruncus sp.]